MEGLQFWAKTIYEYLYLVEYCIEYFDYFLGLCLHWVHLLEPLLLNLLEISNLCLLHGDLEVKLVYMFCVGFGIAFLMKICQRVFDISKFLRHLSIVSTPI